MKKINEEIEKQIETLWLQATPIARMVELTGISDSTIRRYLEKYDTKSKVNQNKELDPLESVAFAECLQYLVSIGKVTEKFDPKFPWNNLTDEVLKIVAEELLSTWGNRENRDWQVINNHYAKLNKNPLL